MRTVEMMQQRNGKLRNGKTKTSDRKKGEEREEIGGRIKERHEKKKS